MLLKENCRSFWMQDSFTLFQIVSGYLHWWKSQRRMESGEYVLNIKNSTNLQESTIFHCLSLIRYQILGLVKITFLFQVALVATTTFKFIQMVKTRPHLLVLRVHLLAIVFHLGHAMPQQHFKGSFKYIFLFYA